MSATAQNILHLDTTGTRLMIGLSIEGKMRFRYTAPTENHRQHSALLVPTIQQALAETGLQPQSLNALAVNLGPGSFTGIRTGLVTARTMAQFLNVPVHGFNTFELLAFQTDKTQAQPVAVYLDALRGRSYHAVLAFDGQGPTYTTLPCLKVLTPAASQTGTAGTILVAPALQPYFEPGRTRAWSESFFSPDAMLTLQAHFGDYFARPWQKIQPLYIQEPSITLPKAKEPRLSDS